MTTRNMLYYNGVWIDIVKIRKCDYTPQYSGQNYIHTRVELSVKGLISSETSYHYVRNRLLASSQEAYPYTVSQVNNGGSVDKLSMSDTRIIGDARYGDGLLINAALSKDPVVEVGAIKHHLCQPRGILVYYLNDSLVFACPQYPYSAIVTDGSQYRSIDAKNGPLPGKFSVTSLSPGSVAIDFSVTCYINEAQSLQSNYQLKYISAHSYVVDVDIDANSMEVRTVAGIVNFRADVLKANEKVPDDFREFFAPPCPIGFKREHFAVKSHPDHSALQYKCVDREIHYSVDRTSTASEAWVGSPVGFDNGFMDRSKITRMQFRRWKDVTLKTSDSVFTGMLDSIIDVAGKKKGINILNVFSLPDNKDQFSIELFGSSIAGKYELERIAFYAMLVSIPYKVLGSSGYQWKLGGDMAGGYVRLDVTRTTPSQYGIGDISFYELNDQIKADSNILPSVSIPNVGNPFQLFGQSNLGYYPTRIYSSPLGGNDVIMSFLGPENTPHLFISSAIDTYRMPSDDPFSQSSYNSTQNRIDPDIVFSNAGAYGNGASFVRGGNYVQEIALDYASSNPFYFTHNKRSHGTAGVSAIVHTTSLMDIADPIGGYGSGDSYAIKRVNTDYRFRYVNNASSSVFFSNQIRASIDAYGVNQNYLNYPVAIVGADVLPAAPYSYSYQAGA